MNQDETVTEPLLSLFTIILQNEPLPKAEIIPT
jgi:hypothetical protein